MKKCTICNEEKDLTEYYKGRGKCKKCFIKIIMANDNDEKRLKRNKWRIDNDYNKKYYVSNSEKEKNRKKVYREANPEIAKIYAIKNKDIILEKKRIYYQNNKEKKCITEREYRRKNKDKINARKRKLREKYVTNPIYRIRYSLKERIRSFLNSRNMQKNNKTFEMVGIKPAELKDYLEKQFQEGMTWDNYGLYGWHIDHIIPISSANNEEELIKLCHYTNLQPLWAIDNIRKSNKIIQQPLL
jgi:hypothetical protein